MSSGMDEVIRIAIGSEPLQRIPAAVLKHSILSRTTRRVEVIESWTHEGGWNPIMSSIPALPRGTKFNTWRWCLPSLFNGGKALYLDSDQVVLADIGELWDALPAGKTIACVCNSVGIFGKKRQPEPGKVQTSVMVADVERLRGRMILANPINRCANGQSTLRMGGRVQTLGPLTYAELMQAAWIPRDEVHELPPEWNHFGIVNESTKLCHWSHVASQPYRNPDHPTAEVFWNELRSAVEAEAISTREVAEEVERGHLHAIYSKRLKRDAA